MARKTLLTEGEMRRFMKLADMRPVGEERIQEMYGTPMGARDEEVGLEDPMDNMGDMDAPDDEKMDLKPMDDMDDEPMDLDEPTEGELDDETQALIAKGIQAMADAMGVGELVTVDVEGEMDVEAPMDVDVTDVTEEPADLGAPEGGDDTMMSAGEMMEETEDVTELEEDVEELDENNEDDIVAEVARRVAARLQRESKQDQVVDELAERIMKRLTK